jgi:hypothetical protein
MADRILNLNQQIALLPATIPDTVLDFLEDFQLAAVNSTESSRSAYDPDYLKNFGNTFVKDLEGLRTEMGKLQQIHVESCGREIQGAFILKLGFDKGERGVGLITRVKERTIIRVLVQAGPYNEASLKEVLKNPPKLG